MQFRVLLSACILFACSAIARENVEAPVRATLSVTPGAAAEGEVVELQLKLTVASPWHVYAERESPDGQQPLFLKLILPKGVQAEGGWARPPHRMNQYLAGDHVFKHRIRVKGGTGKLNIQVTLQYQACDPYMCLPPDFMNLEISLEGSKVAAAPLLNRNPRSTDNGSFWKKPARSCAGNLDQTAARRRIAYSSHKNIGPSDCLRSQ